jgi:Disaggregatase related
VDKTVDPFIHYALHSDPAIRSDGNYGGKVCGIPTIKGLRGERLMTRFKRAISSTFLVGALVQAVAANAATYYVATTGNDANTCAQARTRSTPKQTIPAGVNCLAGGDTLIVKAGTYTNQEIKNPPAGTANAYTVIMGDPSGPRPIMRPAFTSQRGLYCTNGAACHHIELRHLEIDSPYECMKLYGVSTIGYPHHVRYLDNYCHNTKANGILTFSSYRGFIGGDHLIQGNEFGVIGIGVPHYSAGMNTIYNPGNRTIVGNNVFHDGTQGVGIWECGGPDNRQTCGTSPHQIQNVIIRNNIFYRMARTDLNPWASGASLYSCIHVSVTGGGHQIYNNIIYDSGSTSIFKAIQLAARGTDRNLSAPINVYNNTIYNLVHASAYGIFVRQDPPEGPTHVIANNIVYQAGLGLLTTGHTAVGNLTTNPLFVDPASGNFNLKSGSAAIDTGEILDIVTTDLRGVPRPQGAGYDIGAYEAGDGSNPLPPIDLSIQP